MMLANLPALPRKLACSAWLGSSLDGTGYAQVLCPTVICTLEHSCDVAVVTEGRLGPNTVRCFELQEDPYTMSQNL
jgi:hypothetical protein